MLLRACAALLCCWGVQTVAAFPTSPAEVYEVAKVYRRKFLYRKVPQDLYCLMAALRQGFPIMCGL